MVLLLDRIAGTTFGRALAEESLELALQTPVREDSTQRIELTAEAPHAGLPAHPRAEPRRLLLLLEPRLAVVVLQTPHLRLQSPFELVRRQRPSVGHESVDARRQRAAALLVDLAQRSGRRIDM